MRRAIGIVVVFLLLPLWGARNFTETDTAAPQCSQTEAIACSDLTIAESESVGRQVDEGASAGSSEISMSIANGDPAAVFGWFESDQVNDTSWASGNWTVRMNVTTADDTNIVNCKICRVNSDCSSVLGTVGNDSTATSLATTGTKTWTVSGAAQASANSTDLFLVVFDGLEVEAHSTSSVGYTPSLNIDTPLAAAAAAPRHKFLGVTD